MMTTPNVIVRTHYYEVGSTGRDFYSCNKKNDYLSYIDSGIKSDQKIRDYLDYAGNEEKSSELFSEQGLLSKEDKKELREKLRNTKSCIWDFVISFKREYGHQHVPDWKTANQLLNKTLPRLYKSLGLDPKNMTWYAGLHTNVDSHNHIHLSFFENNPSIYSHKLKGYRCRKGKLGQKQLNDFKMNVEGYFLEPINSVKEVRATMVKKAKSIHTLDFKENQELVSALLKDLYE